MLLNNCELIPGVVQSSKDPENLGRIKCVIPGVIDSETMSLENMPWAYPLGMAHYQSFSKPIEGQKVWVLINKSNYNEYWYLPFFEYNDKTKEYLNSGVYENDNPEVMMCRNLGDNTAISTYDDKNGFSTKIGDNVHIDIHPDSHIELLAGEAQVDIDGQVKCGQKDGDWQPTIKGDNLATLLNELANAFSILQGASANASFLTPLEPGFKKALSAIQKNIDNIKAEHCQVN